MKTLIACLIFCFTLLHANSYAQVSPMNKEVEDMIQLGKDAIVQLAFELIDVELSKQNFSSIKVFTDGNKLYVSLCNPIKYLPINTAFHGDVLVELTQKTTIYGPISNGIYDKEMLQFYRPTEESKQSIQFVIEAINKSDDGPTIDVEYFADDMVIREFETYYQATIVTDTQEAFYKIDKGSAQVFDTQHAPLEALPFAKEEQLIEVE